MVSMHCFTQRAAAASSGVGTSKMSSSWTWRVGHFRDWGFGFGLGLGLGLASGRLCRLCRLEPACAKRLEVLIKGLGLVLDKD